MTIHPTVERANGHAPRLDLPVWVTRETLPEPSSEPPMPAEDFSQDSAAARTHRRADLDADLQKTVRRTSYMRQLFYVVVLLVALAGQVSGAVEALGIPLLAAIPAVGALELGGIVVLANADVRRRLGERATASRVLSVAIAGFAVAFNWMAHDSKLLAGFFAGMSALGYLVWLMHTENQRRDRLRATGDLPPTAPAYELWGHWVVHPWLTRRARSMAKQDPRLGLYSSLDAARAEYARAKRISAIARVVRQEIHKKADPDAAVIALEVFEMDEVAVRLQEGADYDGLTALVAARLNPNALVNGPEVHLPDAPQAHLPDALEVRLTDAPGPRPGGLVVHVPDALAAAPVLGFTGAPVGASAESAPDAPDAPGSDAPRARTQTRPALPIRRAASGAARTRPSADATRLLKHAAGAEKPPSIREVQRLFGVGAPRAKALMQEAGLLPAETNKEN